MAWTDQCKIAAVENIDSKVNQGLSVREALKVVSKESDIPAGTLKRWKYPEPSVPKNGNTSHKKKKVEERPEAAAQPTYEQLQKYSETTGPLYFADLAILQLERIMDGDETAEEAIDNVIEWCHAKLEKLGKTQHGSARKPKSNRAHWKALASKLENDIKYLDENCLMNGETDRDVATSILLSIHRLNVLGEHYLEGVKDGATQKQDRGVMS